ncbi:Crp/Fnr family transcriptional regulator [Tenacibaculum tangerinum]|uniref:Crp/Fnr family transcriptional regulator n=1 Tax=Tenacibaculum tangerinum TaxID=3038772 RepID=A0ABY8L5Z5_9FLAO|nr:Crp/Fnr family transcriptional regulator [Tenacibaculum tangerinum]WGH76699.1 Crp/Fnr family transcriptional regulator [Tenacibaculum tangerinum]
MINNFKKFIKQISPISDIEFEQTVSTFKKQTLNKGDFLVQQGKVCKQIAFINKGILRTFYLNDKAEETTSCFCTENNLTTSYKSFILQQPSTLSLQALEETELLIIDYDNLQKLYSTSIVWQTIGRVVAEREYIIMEKYASVLNNETAKKKYLRLLKEQPSVLQKAKIEDIASYLGITRRTLSRIRQEVSK